ncbi:TetR/AcrR family transcriptional regulator [Bacillus sp. 165]|uniref:TetR/AcrR family transcriptional regulator n=1 Tax=Bacillus sp. 165 TaxID=1529117 RepID=UPI001ADCA118|nr:TetR/AcrR family transcriptional regulator [Bacillus sp. 165]MBO9129425.1 TetR/AcrR family transcriptional regulator [Bacillus sp. 165]
MNDRKLHVIKTAHQLFIEKGFQATSIQDILDQSGISKGTFYNYFSSKNELLIALLKMLYTKLEQDRNVLLLDQDPSNIEIFIKQMEMQMKMNKTNKIISLLEESTVLNDPDLKQYIRYGSFKMLRWLYNRFIDIFGEDKKPFLLDCAIMFLGILQHNLNYYSMVHESNTSIHTVVRYSVERVVRMVAEVAETREQLIPPELLDTWLPDCQKVNQTFEQKLRHTIFTLKEASDYSEEPLKYIELLDFVQHELLHSKSPRKFLVESALLSLKTGKVLLEKKELETLDLMVAAYFTPKKETE